MQNSVGWWLGVEHTVKRANEDGRKTFVTAMTSPLLKNKKHVLLLCHPRIVDDGLLGGFTYPDIFYYIP
jgi:hypothetical protein